MVSNIHFRFYKNKTKLKAKLEDVKIFIELSEGSDTKIFSLVLQIMYWPCIGFWGIPESLYLENAVQFNCNYPNKTCSSSIICNKFKGVQLVK